MGVYHGTARLPIWSTEFGYQTTPPDPEESTVSPTTAAYYLNWAEYITYENPRLKSFDQFLLTDPPSGIFASGLLTAAGTPKPGYFAYRIPCFSQSPRLVTVGHLTFGVVPAKAPVWPERSTVPRRSPSSTGPRARACGRPCARSRSPTPTDTSRCARHSQDQVRSARRGHPLIHPQSKAEPSLSRSAN